MKTAAFTVRGSQEQAIRWNRASQAEGFPSVGAWASGALDAYLKVRARAGLPMNLAWTRGHFRAVLMDGSEIEVRGVVSPPFGVYQGTSHGPDGNKLRTLVHLPTKRVVATLRSSRQCRQLASELAPVYARDDAASAAITERHRREST